MRRRLAFTSIVAASLISAGCAVQSSGGSPVETGSGTPAASACTPATMKTITPDQLTLAADQPLYEPWYADNNPTNGKGFEDAMAYAIAHQLGYTNNQIKWTRVIFNKAIQPGPKNFDFDLDEFSITPAREKVVDFSAPYYTVTQAVIAMKGTKGAAATSLADLRQLKLGAQVGSTSLTAITDQIKPTHQPAAYPTTNDAKQGLVAGQIDGLVVDLPTAFYITSAQIKGATIVGQIAPEGSHPEQFGALLAKDSPITACVSKAVDALAKSGQLQAIQDKWLAQVAGAPVLK